MSRLSTAFMVSASIKALLKISFNVYKSLLQTTLDKFFSVVAAERKYIAQDSVMNCLKVGKSCAVEIA